MLVNVKCCSMTWSVADLYWDAGTVGWLKAMLAMPRAEGGSPLPEIAQGAP